MSISTEQIQEVLPLLQALAYGKDWAEDDAGGTFNLEGQDTFSRTVAWPRSTLMDGLRFFMTRPFDSQRMARRLVELDIVAGPHKTSRIIDGKKVYKELWTVSERAVTRWENEHT